MGTYNSAVITNGGQSMIAQAVAGASLEFTTIKTSSYAYPAGTNLATLTTISGIKQSKDITSATVYNSRVIKISAAVDNTGISTAYTINTIGIYAKVGSSAESLFAVVTASAADTMPAYDNKPYSYIYEINLTMQNAANVTVTVNAAGLVNVADLNAAKVEIQGEIADLKSAIDVLSTDVETIKEESYGTNINVLDLGEFDFGWINADGTIGIPDTTTKLTGFIEVPDDATYITHTSFVEKAYETQLKYIRQVGIYDANKQFVSRDNNNAYTHSLPSTAKYIRVTIAVSNLSQYSMLSFTSTKLDKWIPNRTKPLNYYNALYGKSLVCFGDSVCRGQNWTVTDGVYPNDNSGWAKILKDKNAMQVYGYGINGATICKIQDNTNSVYEQLASFVYRATSSNYIPDYMLIEGGINDATTHTDMGEITSTFDQSNYYTTFIGALERIFYTIKTTFPKCKTMFIIPFHCSGYVFQADLQTYIAAIRQVCDKWSIPVIDLYTKGRLNGCITATRSAFFDEWGVHPNEEGYKIVTDDIEQAMLCY